ncbi:MAG: hypothetical protein MUE60_13175 [Candidatus Eisenbacteria bacterium]|jgi:hypothetical protein|nr:hypothetical protein [Candidatus Eisenbacteria bacterium]
MDCGMVVLLTCAIHLLAGNPGADDQIPADVRPDSLQSTLHPHANLLVWPPPSEEVTASVSIISPSVAAESAAVALTRRGVTEPVICEARWIAGAVSGYLVDATGDLAFEGLHYSVFRIGIRDGAEAQYGDEFRAGSEFVFIALGWDNYGAQVWNPPPGPDYRPPEDESFDRLLPYEFLLDHAAFETLPRRYPRRESTQ